MQSHLSSILAMMTSSLGNINKKYKSILCLNGHLPDIDFFNNISGNIPIIAADGAANNLIAMGIKPKLVIGDLDSLRSDLYPLLEKVYLPDQNYCDFEKTVGYLISHNLWPALILGMNGGYLDCIFKNLTIFAKFGGILYDEGMVGLIVKSGQKLELCLPYFNKISLFGVPEAELTTIGLKWELNRMKLIFPSVMSTSNRVTAEKLTIQSYSGTALILIYSCESVTLP